MANVSRSSRILWSLFCGAVVLIAIVAAAPIHAHSKSPALARASIPAVEMLNPDGTLNREKGAVSSLDLARWNLNPGRLPGPILVPKAGEDWSMLGNGVKGNSL